MSIKTLSLAAISLLALVDVSQAEENALSLFNSNTIKIEGEIRSRYEYVETNNAINKADAVTTRLQLSLESTLLNSDTFSGYLQMTDVEAGNDYYNSGINGQTTYNIVADPMQTRLTQGYIKYDNGTTLIKAGRQMINIDSQRFVGAVGWRQMPQTFTGYTLVNNSIKDLHVTAAYLTDVHTIFAAGSVQGDSYVTNSALLHADYKMFTSLDLSAFAYLIGSKHDTYGMTLKGTYPVSKDMGVDYRADFATQRSASLAVANSGKPVVDARYYNLEANFNSGGFSIGLASELLGADQPNSTAFSTPFATLHKFNGWADKFLATPVSGLLDMSAHIGYKSSNYGAIKAVYHNFSSDLGSIHYGDELDLLYKLSMKSIKGLGALVKYANYLGGDSAAAGNSTALATDTQKLWVMLDYQFSNK